MAEADPTLLEQSFGAICAKHDLTSLEICFNLKQAESSRFCAVAHWDGYSNSVNSCTIEYGETIQDAVTRCLNTVGANRIRVGFYPQLSHDEALPIGEAA